LTLMKRLLRWLNGSVMLCALAACAAISPRAHAQQETTAASALISAGEELDRRLAPLDIVIIEVFGEKDLCVERRVQQSGSITYPLLGNVDVAGRTPAEVEKLLEQRLGEDYLIEPVVTVMVKEYRSRTVSVIGRVNRGGAIELPGEHRIDVLEAIARAGDFHQLANKNRIQLNRGGKTIFYRFDDLVKLKDPQKKVWVEPGDVIYVHESFW
jgi:polysaccharide biosynthesis/export protein